MASTERYVLPKDVKPINYEIALHDLELGGSFSFQGVVKIELEVKKATSRLTLNAYQLKIHNAEIWIDAAKSHSASNISFDEEARRLTLSFEHELPLSKSAKLEVRYEGTMNDVMAGFYRSKYKPATIPHPSTPKDGDRHLMFSTQFESSDACRAFPCFDEPNLKATFDFSIEIPEGQIALSNMPEKETQKGSSGRKIVSFRRTPIMSTYLLAWAFGDFEYVEDLTKRDYDGKKLPVRVYTTRGLKEQGRFGLENASQVVDYFSEIFQIDYPLPKVDLLAVHELSHDAMENWGLITYRTTAILFDEERSDAAYRNKVAYVVAHELAHQWFGNLVTMDWWSELWLNEGFATWVGWFAVDRFHPDYLPWTQFVAESLQTAFQLDSLRASHAIEVPVRNALEIDQIFDAISYLKGCSVIRMLSNHLDVKTFLWGVSEYLKKHAYGNATTLDLWRALSQASGKDVERFMDPWIRQVGFPVLTVAEEPGQIGVRQSRFLLTGNVSAQEDEALWWIPLGLKTNSKDTTKASTALTTKQETIRNVDDSFYKLNADCIGFYRTNYPAERLARLGVSRADLTIEDRVGLVADAAALALAGDGTTASLLALVERFSNETNYAVWVQVVRSVFNVRSIFAENEVITNGLKAFALKLLTSVTEKIGWSFPPNEDFITGQLRALLISAAGDVGHEATIVEAKRRFQAYKSGDSKAVHPSLRSAIFRINVAEGGKDAYEAVKAEYFYDNSIDGKEICLLSLGQVQTAGLVKDFLEFQFSDHVAIQDIHSGSIALAENPRVRGFLWKWIKGNWTTVQQRLSGNSVVIDRYVKKSLQSFASHDIERDIAAFFENQDTKGYERSVIEVSDMVRGNANYKERDQDLVIEWLQAHNYI